MQHRHVCAFSHRRDEQVGQPYSAYATVSPQPLLQVEWLPDDRTVVVTAADGTVSVFDAEEPGASSGRATNDHPFSYVRTNSSVTANKMFGGV